MKLTKQAIILTTAASLLISCSSVKKSSSSNITSHQVTETKAADSTGKKLIDSTAINSGSITASHVDSSQHSKTITIDIDTNYTGSNSSTAEEYTPVDSSGDIKPIKPVRKGNKLVIDAWNPGPAVIDLGAFKPLKITITETGQQFNRNTIAGNYKDSSGLHSSDTAARHSVDNTTVQDDSKNVTTNKKRTGWPLMTFIAVFCVILITLVILFFRKRIKKINEQY